jgi:HlyD family type I secretion membrane fusion protein
LHKAHVLSLQRSVSEYESRQLSNEAELAQARQRLGALDARVRSLRDSLVQQASEELRDVGMRIADNEQRLRATTDDQSRQKVLAPEAGRLMNLRINTVGSALGPREPIVDVVPRDAPLLVEARLPLDVAADVRPGMPAELRILTAQARYEKLLPAEVRQVSADAQVDERTGTSYVSAQLQVPASALAQRQTPLQPGMAAEVYIRVAERTPLGFLLEPVGGYFRRAFR